MAEEREERAEEPSIAEWRATWRALEAPVPPDDLGRVDARTQAAVGWLRAAWRGLEVPEAPAPRARRRPLRRRALPLAAAAALLVAAAAWLVLARERPRPPRIELAQSPADGEADQPRIAAIGPDRIEMQSGPVRLVLVNPPRSGEANGRKTGD